MVVQPWYAERRHLVLERDLYTCRDCGTTGRLGKHAGDVQIHHIKSRQEGGTDDEENLLTLCVRCHRVRDRPLAAAGMARARPLVVPPGHMTAD